jgi:hypothetical protein
LPEVLWANLPQIHHCAELQSQIIIVARRKNPMFDKLSEEELHEWRSSELYDALKFDTREAVIDCLKKLDRLDGEFLKIIVQGSSKNTDPS